ncbi:MAG: magnesium transporter CorA family protein [Candidatus Cloacimonetes bacterium]|jgi:magnesium transporter|nr:magnesium transporter CorA family protein [Candidatus Cloacimonadota bacterium]MDY0336423.1 magnesium transporter CorA family protein [Candidatus Cloacimonadaceae bacterium]MCB5269275.1 magnesium transporter CorA family protein [Candidatus Cloacimonadota bacterium]MCK9334534.1 magnesium transporter CorA family protein [Candidatus Cloacimonadota bacterium]MDD2543816.1 magnesium transporter CorA family protein [Candidatus Cloacimonadota bacterium]
MIQYYKVVEQRFVPAITAEEAFWLHLESPDAEDVSSLIQKYELPEDFITDLQDADENSRLEYDEEAMLIILRVPLYYRHRSASVSFATAPLGIIVIPDKLITVSFYENEVLTQYLEGKHRPFNITQQSFLLSINLRAAMYFLKFLKEINRRTTNIENELHQSMRNKELIRLLRMEKSLVFFNTALKSNEIILERLQRSRWLQNDPDAEDMIEDVIIENKQAIEMANIYSSILSGMMDAFASIISNNLNVVMKFLTSITIILALPTLIASIYGMNVDLPMQNNPFAFALVMGFALLLSILLVIIFIRKKYF